ncbi:DNA-binding CsgD family transcriptional regulator [Streptosporangium becharense]|uniref:DNA-binding CsgD family transcriptional regulator n=1 Tax=Streptosporangium becharense TaxID=1816182 RepID=A0A7W9IF53_9ACTN|nr:helix-turn-helix domain-containing protein [Streptosporangium becharense]MBB2909496.1 DNA-binding CsgD family transcriptional regulator [Streptosporangium becharense]MBB5819547.1 DNA-binding CsgD family transcriptional regulator [Streptosporangium becharense]
MRTDTPPPHDPLETLGLTPAQTALYNAVLRLHRATCAELAEATDRSPEPLGRELAALVRLGVVDEQGGEYLARHPAAALGRLIADRLDRLAAESRRIDTVLGSIRSLIHQYDAGLDHQSGDFAVDLVSGADELYESVIGMAVQAPPLELLYTVPDKRTMSDFAHRYADQWIGAQRAGLLSCRVVVAVRTLEIPGVRDKLDRFSLAGAEIRTLGTVPSWFLVAGSGAAGMPAQWGGTLPENAYHFHLVRAVIVVAALRSLFEELWARAAPLPWTHRDDGVVRVLRLAGQGMPDEMIARQLGISVRTVRARFADAMAELGVQTRFQAGVEAARRGWLSRDAP